MAIIWYWNSWTLDQQVNKKKTKSISLELRKSFVHPKLYVGFEFLSNKSVYKVRRWPFELANALAYQNFKGLGANSRNAGTTLSRKSKRELDIVVILT